MGWFGLWREGPVFPSFEKALQELELRIERNREQLAAIRAREQWAVVTVTTYCLVVWSMYAGAWWMGWVEGRVVRLLGLRQGAPTTVARFVEAGPTWLIPLGIVFIRRLFHWWYRRKQESEEKHLRSLQKQLRDKVEELKRQTSYYSTRELLERYDEKLRRADARGVSAPAGPRARVPPQMQQTPTKSGPPTPGSRGWADRVAEALLGEDELRPENKYALVCANCHAHNGLVLEDELYTLRYVCPRCHHLNQPKNPAKRTRVEPPAIVRRSSSPEQRRKAPLPLKARDKEIDGAKDGIDEKPE